MNTPSTETVLTASPSLLQMYMRDVASKELITPEDECVLSRQIQSGLHLNKLPAGNESSEQKRSFDNVQERVHVLLRQLPQMQKVADALADFVDEATPSYCGMVLKLESFQAVLKGKLTEDVLEKMVARLKVSVDEARKLVAELDYILELIPLRALLERDGAIFSQTFLAVPNTLAKQLYEPAVLEIWGKHWEQIGAWRRKARHRMIEGNLRLVILLANAQKGSDAPAHRLDLIQGGNLGLIQAVDRFDYRRGYRFSTYSSWWIVQAIKRTISENTRAMRLPAHMEEDVAKVLRAQYRLRQIYGEEPSVAALAKEVRMAPRSVEQVLNLTNPVRSIYSPVGGDDGGNGVELHDMIKDPSQRSPDVELTRSSLSDVMSRVFDKTLNKKERLVMRMRYGIGYYQRYTLTNAGKELGMSRESVRRIENAALLKLRKSAQTAGLYDYWSSDDED